jgi:hypothetical protein
MVKIQLPKIIIEHKMNDINVTEEIWVNADG